MWIGYRLCNEYGESLISDPDLNPPWTAYQIDVENPLRLSEVNRDSLSRILRDSSRVEGTLVKIPGSKCLLKVEEVR